MDKKIKLYTSGEFAKLTGVNKRTLHYYNDIGLFRPKEIGEYGYHYYSVDQFAQLEMILTLRKIGMSIEEITKYIKDPSKKSFLKIIKDKNDLIDKTINDLLNIKCFLNKKADRIALGNRAEDKKIELCTLPERNIVLSSCTAGKTEEEYYSAAADFSLLLKKQFNLYDEFGCRLSLENIMKDDYDHYDCYYAYTPEKSSWVDLKLEAGTYLRAYSIGSWDKLPDLYRKIKKYAIENNLELLDYAYEEGLNYLSLNDDTDHVTMITIKCCYIRN